jgi:hypothetical protein
MPHAEAGYRGLLRTPGAAAFFLAAAIGRTGIAMTGLGLVWLLHARTGSYGTAGLAAAGFSVAEAVAGPQLARLIDRFGQGRVLPFALLAHGAAMAGVLVFRAPAAVVATATCAGAFVPQLGALSAARWAGLLRGARAAELPAAFSLESLANATAFLLGPLLAASLGAAVLTQAFTWNNSASAAGLALAAALAGRAADAWGSSAALALAPVAGLILFVLALATSRPRSTASRCARPRWRCPWPPERSRRGPGSGRRPPGQG